MRRVIRMRAGWVLLLAALAACSGGDGAESEPRTVVVGSSGAADYGSIQDAIDDVGAASTILIEPGTYDERVIVIKALSLIGSGPGTLIELAGPDEPDPDDTGVPTSAVIEIRDATNVRVESLSVTGPKDGILVRESTDVVLASVVASGNGDEGVDVRQATRVTITGTFEDNGDEGVQVREASDQVVVQSSTATGNAQDGIKIRDSSNCYVRDNTSSSNGDEGILVRDSTLVEVTGNTVTDNGGYGIRVASSPQTLVDGNTVSGNVEGDIQID